MNIDTTKISESEYEIMKVIWSKYPIKAQEIVDLFKVKSDWSEKTIKTLISRLLKKDAIGYEKEGKAYMYHPLIKEIQYRKFENTSFLKRVYSGTIDNMLLNFIKDIKLSRSELDQIKKLLDEDDE